MGRERESAAPRFLGLLVVIWIVFAIPGPASLRVAGETSEAGLTAETAETGTALTTASAEIAESGNGSTAESAEAAEIAEAVETGSGLTTEGAGIAEMGPVGDRAIPAQEASPEAAVAALPGPLSVVDAQAAAPPMPTAMPTPGANGRLAAAGEGATPSSRAGVRAVAEVQVRLEIDGNRAHWAFLQAAVGPAQESQRATGVPASVTIAQAIHESAWGTSRLSREGHNYFGIKASSKPGTNGKIEMNTGENIGGKQVTVNAAFRAYNSMVESFNDHGRFFLENDRYARAMANRDDPRKFITMVAEAGYATDPAYARKVLAYMDRYNLYQYDARSE